MECEISSGVVSDPGILGGRLVLKGRRGAVSQLLAQLAGGMTLQELQSDYELTDAEIKAILRYAALTAREKDAEHAHAPRFSKDFLQPAQQK